MRLVRFPRTAKTAEVKGISLTPAEAEQFPQAARDMNITRSLLMALRAGIRRGELVAVQWGDIQFGKNEAGENRFIVVEPQLCEARVHHDEEQEEPSRGSVARAEAGALIEFRDKRLLEAFLRGRNDISGDLVFPSPEGSFWTRIISATGIFSRRSPSPGYARSGSMI